MTRVFKFIDSIFSQSKIIISDLFPAGCVEYQCVYREIRRTIDTMYYILYNMFPHSLLILYYISFMCV